MYGKWGKFDKAEPYYRKLLALQEKDFGADNPRLCPTLQVLANALTNLGQVEEAPHLRKRSQILMMAMNHKRQSNVAWAGFLRLRTLTFGRPTWVVTRTPAQAELGRGTLGS
jgi:hypothetical protein